MAQLLGTRLAAAPDEYVQRVAGLTDEAKIQILQRECKLPEICARYAEPMTAPGELDDIEWALQLLTDRLGADRVERSFAAKLRDGRAYDEFYSELSVVATCAVFCTIEALEHKTGVGGRDADVRATWSGETFNLEVTQRTDNWLAATGRTMDVMKEDLTAEGEDAWSRPENLGRPTISDYEQEEVAAHGYRVPEAGPGSRKVPAHEGIRVALRGKAEKFQADGVNLIVVCTRKGYPTLQSCGDAVYGPAVYSLHAPDFDLHAARLQETALFREPVMEPISGVVYLDTMYYLHRLRQRLPAQGGGPGVGQPGLQSTSGFFPNPNAAYCLSERSLRFLTSAFDAGIYL